MAPTASNIYQTLEKFSMAYVLRNTNSTLTFAIFIKSQIYRYSYLTIWPDDFHLSPPQQKKAVYLIVLLMPPSSSPVQAKTSWHPSPFKVWVTTTTLGSWDRILLEAFSLSQSAKFCHHRCLVWNRKFHNSKSVSNTSDFWSFRFSNCSLSNS